MLIHFLHASIAQKRVPTFIIDTDFTGDCDDALAMGIALQAHKAGLIKIVGCIVSSTTPTAAPGLYGLLKGYGYHNSIPIYAYQGATGTYNNTYTTELRDRFGVAAQTRTAYTNDLTGYRTLVKNNPGVTIIGIGAPVSLSRFLSSTSDGIDSRTGAQMIAANVKMAVQMAGNFPTGVAEYNATRDITSTQNIATNWPSTVPFHWTGGEVGGTVYSQPPLSADPTTDPIRYVFDVYATNNVLTIGRRASWDPLATYYAIYGLGSNFSIAGANGSVAVDGTGVTTWSATTGPHSYIGKVASDGDLGFLLDAAVETFCLGGAPASVTQFRFPLTEGTGQTFSSSTSTFVGTFGAVKVAEAADPVWLDLGTNQWVVNNPSGNRIATLPVNPGLMNNNNMIGSVVARPTTANANQTLMSMFDLGGAKFLFRSGSTGKLQLLTYNDNTASPNTQYLTSAVQFVANTWALYSFELIGTTLKLYTNGVAVLTATVTTPPVLNPKRTRISLFGRNNAGAVSDGFIGAIAAAEFRVGAVSGDLANMETALRAIATAKGITLP